MQIDSIPENFSGVLSDAIFRIVEADPQIKADVHVLTSDGVSRGAKYIAGESSYDVNAAPYLRDMVVTEPYVPAVTGFFSHVGRHCRARLRIDRRPYGGTSFAVVYSKYVTFIGGDRRKPEGELLTDAGHVATIAPGQTDEMSFCLPWGGVYAEITLTDGVRTQKLRINDLADGTASAKNYFSCGEGMTTLHINMDDIAARAGGGGWYSGMRVELFRMTSAITSVVIASKEYRVLQAGEGGTRLCWINRYGALDYCNFSPVVRRTLTSEKHLIRTAGGYVAADAGARAAELVVSECEPARVAEWMALAAAAPRVWVEEDGGFTLIEVDDATATVYDSGRLEPVKLTITKLNL